MLTTILFLALVVPTVATPWQEVRAGVAPLDEGFFELVPDARVRRRMCSGALVLYVASKPMPKLALTEQAQALADVLRRPVVSFVWPRGNPASVVSRGSEKIAAWIRRSVDDRTRLQVLAHGRGAEIVKLAFEAQPAGRARATVYALDARADFSIPGVDVWRIVGNEVAGPSDSGAKQASDAPPLLPFEQYLKHFRRHAYGERLDDLLRCPEKRRHPRELDLFEMRMVAHATYVGGAGNPMRTRFDLEEEKRRLDKWLAHARNRERVDENPELIRLFNRLTADKGGPKHWFLDWYPLHRTESEEWRKDPEAARARGASRWIYAPSAFAHHNFVPINMHDEAFLTRDLNPGATRVTQDAMRNPALRYAIVARRSGEYADMSERNVGRAQAIIVRGRVRITPVFRSRVPGRGIISGNFTQAELIALTQDIRSALRKAEGQAPAGK